MTAADLRSFRYWAKCIFGAALFWGAIFVLLAAGRIAETAMGVTL